MLAGSKAGTGGPEGEEEVSVQKRGGQADGSDQSAAGVRLRNGQSGVTVLVRKERGLGLVGGTFGHSVKVKFLKCLSRSSY